MNKKSIIYCIENLINNKKYIGSSSNHSQRERMHLYYLNHGTHQNIHLQESWKKYGEENFSFYIIEYCDEDEKIEREQHWIDTYNTLDPKLGYNMRDANVQGKWGKEMKENASKRMKKIMSELGMMICPDCGKEVRKTSYTQKRCKQCTAREYKKSRIKHPEGTVFHCDGCGEEILKTNNSQKYCKNCGKEIKREKDMLRIREKRKKIKCLTKIFYIIDDIL